MPDMQVRALAFIGDAGGGISDEKNKIFFVPYLTLAEAHHAEARTWIENLQHFSGAKIVKITATAYRTDRKNLVGELVYYSGG